MRLNRLALGMAVALLAGTVMGQMSIEPPAPAPANAATQETARPPTATSPNVQGTQATTAPSASSVLENLLQQNKPAVSGEAATTTPPPSPAAQNPTAVPAVPNVAPHPVKTNRIREGEFIWNRTGHLVRDEKTGNWYFDFEADQKNMQDPPMQLIPSKFLMAMEDASNGGADPVRFKVSGQVTEYRGKNYLWVQHMEILRDLNKGIGG